MKERRICTFVSRRLQREIDLLEKGNAVLTKKAETGEKAGITRQIETAKLQSNYQSLLRFVDSLPDEIKQQARLPQKLLDQER